MTSKAAANAKSTKILYVDQKIVEKAGANVVLKSLKSFKKKS